MLLRVYNNGEKMAKMFQKISCRENETPTAFKRRKFKIKN